MRLSRRAHAVARARSHKAPAASTHARLRRSIDAIFTGNGESRVKVTWFYRPEEAVGGRKAFHGARELFRSDHTDVVGVASILGRCRVHGLRDFLALGSKPEEREFFARFVYHAAKQTFEPRKVPVFCLCDMPYNPDMAMLECSACGQWYHPECLLQARAARREALQAARASGRFTCHACAGAGANGS